MVLLVTIEKALLGRHVRLDGLQILAVLEQLSVHLGFLFVKESRTIIRPLLVTNALNLMAQVLQVAVLVLELLFQAFDRRLLIKSQAALTTLLRHTRALCPSTYAGVRYAGLYTLLRLIISLPFKSNFDFLF